MRLNPNFKIIQPEDDDRNLVRELEFCYRFEEAGRLIELLEQARSAEADGYILAEVLGDTAFQAYYRDTVGQISDVIDFVAPVAALELIQETESFLANHSV